MSKPTSDRNWGAIDIIVALFALGIGAALALMASGSLVGTPAQAAPPVTTTTVHRPHVANLHPASPPRGMNNQFHSLYINGDPNYDSTDNNDYAVTTKCAGFGHFRVWIQYDRGLFVNSDYACP